jgi:hypothetical protein
MWDLVLAAVDAAVGTSSLARRDHLVAQFLEVPRRFPAILRIPFTGRRSMSEHFHRRLITFDGVFCLAMATL